MKAAITFNLKKKLEAGMPEDYYAEFDDISVPNAIKASIERQGFDVDLLQFDKDLYNKLLSNKYNFVFNIAEGFRGESRESHVPALLEILGIPYTGSGIITQAITLDKARTKDILMRYNLPTSKFCVVDSTDGKIDASLKYPLMIKPNFEGSSKGITSLSLSKSPKEAKRTISYILENYNQPALVEEFLPGREFTVSLLGNKEVYALPAIEIIIEKYSDGSGIYHFKNKFVDDDSSLHKKADLEGKLKNEIYEISKKAYRVLGCRDLSRIDIRLDSKGNPNIIEMNCLPGLNPDPKYGSYFTLSCLWSGINYNEMIDLITYFALERYGMEKLLNQKSVDSTINKIRQVDIYK